MGNNRRKWYTHIVGKIVRFHNMVAFRRSPKGSGIMWREEFSSGRVTGLNDGLAVSRIITEGTVSKLWKVGPMSLTYKGKGDELGHHILQIRDLHISSVQDSHAGHQTKYGSIGRR